MVVSRSPTVLRAVRRARWLAEVATALDRASKLTLRLSQHSPDSSEAIVLRARIMALRTEVDSVRRGRSADNDGIHPNRIK